MNEDLKRIKKLYGEKMAHLCRELFPSLLEEKGDLPRLLETYFAPNCQLCEDIHPFYIKKQGKKKIF